MNKKGDVIILFGIFFILISVIIILALKQNQVDTSTINKTIESFNWTKYYNQIHSSLQNSSEGMPYYYVLIISIIDKAIDFLGYALFGIAKLSMELTRDNPDIINYKLLLFLVLLSLLAPLIYPIFIVVVSLVLIIKEYFQNRKEKKMLGEVLNERD